MRQYDKAYIPVNQMANEGIYLIATEKTITGSGNIICMPLRAKEWLEEHSNAIVVTIKNLQDLWKAAERYAYYDARYGADGTKPDFSQYLKEQGIIF